MSPLCSHRAVGSSGSASSPHAHTCALTEAFGSAPCTLSSGTLPHKPEPSGSPPPQALHSRLHLPPSAHGTVGPPAHTCHLSQLTAHGTAGLTAHTRHLSQVTPMAASGPVFVACFTCFVYSLCYCYFAISGKIFTMTPFRSEVKVLDFTECLHHWFSAIP